MITPASLSRREYKCLIDEATVDRIRRYIAGICVVDPYALGTGRYMIDTLYLDTPSLDTYRAAIEERGDRYKLRIRGYPSAPDAPVFLEVKRRIGDTIRKTRVAITGDWSRVLAHGELPPLPSKQRAALDNFICHYHYLPMQPTVLVRYEREPYFSVLDDYARVTFDRMLAFQPTTELSMLPQRDAWMPIDHALAQNAHASLVLLELKFTSVVPAWMRRMVQALELPREAFCKYTRAIDALHGAPMRRVAY